MLAARGKAGLANGIDLILQDEISAYQAVELKLRPSCTEEEVIERDIQGRVLVREVQYTCVAYNGDTAFGDELWYRGQLRGPGLNREAVANRATQNTSRAVALDALPRLQAPLP